MTRSFRQSKFRRTNGIGEDVNPQAYIVNLADCMLVLACGFMVALISYWNIQVAPGKNIDSENLQQVNPSTIDSESLSTGNYYQDVGRVYRDPQTGALYMVEGATETPDSNSSNDMNNSAEETDDSKGVYSNDESQLQGGETISQPDLD